MTLLPRKQYEPRITRIPHLVVLVQKQAATPMEPGQDRARGKEGYQRNGVYQRRGVEIWSLVVDEMKEREVPAWMTA